MHLSTNTDQLPDVVVEELEKCLKQCAVSLAMVTLEGDCVRYFVELSDDTYIGVLTACRSDAERALAKYRGQDHGLIGVRATAWPVVLPKPML